MRTLYTIHQPLEIVWEFEGSNYSIIFTDIDHTEIDFDLDLYLHNIFFKIMCKTKGAHAQPLYANVYSYGESVTRKWLSFKKFLLNYGI